MEQNETKQEAILEINDSSVAKAIPKLVVEPVEVEISNSSLDEEFYVKKKLQRLLEKEGLPLDRFRRYLLTKNEEDGVKLLQSALELKQIRDQLHGENYDANEIEDKLKTIENNWLSMEDSKDHLEDWMNKSSGQKRAENVDAMFNHLLEQIVSSYYVNYLFYIHHKKKDYEERKKKIAELEAGEKKTSNSISQKQSGEGLSPSRSPKQQRHSGTAEDLLPSKSPKRERPSGLHHFLFGKNNDGEKQFIRSLIKQPTIHDFSEEVEIVEKSKKKGETKMKQKKGFDGYIYRPPNPPVPPPAGVKRLKMPPNPPYFDELIEKLNKSYSVFSAYINGITKIKSREEEEQIMNSMKEFILIIQEAVKEGKQRVFSIPVVKEWCGKRFRYFWLTEAIKDNKAVNDARLKNKIYMKKMKYKNAANSVVTAPLNITLDATNDINNNVNSTNIPSNDMMNAFTPVDTLSTNAENQDLNSSTAKSCAYGLNDTPQQEIRKMVFERYVVIKEGSDIWEGEYSLKMPDLFVNDKNLDTKSYHYNFAPNLQAENNLNAEKSTHKSRLFHASKPHRMQENEGSIEQSNQFLDTVNLTADSVSSTESVSSESKKKVKSRSHHIHLHSHSRSHSDDGSSQPESSKKLHKKSAEKVKKGHSADAVQERDKSDPNYIHSDEKRLFQAKDTSFLFVPGFMNGLILGEREFSTSLPCLENHTKLNVMRVCAHPLGTCDDNVVDIYDAIASSKGLTADCHKLRHEARNSDDIVLFGYSKGAPDAFHVLVDLAQGATNSGNAQPNAPSQEKKESSPEAAVDPSFNVKSNLFKSKDEYDIEFKKDFLKQLKVVISYCGVNQGSYVANKSYQNLSPFPIRGAPDFVLQRAARLLNGLVPKNPDIDRPERADIVSAVYSITTHYRTNYLTNNIQAVDQLNIPIFGICAVTPFDEVPFFTQKDKKLIDGFDPWNDMMMTYEQSLIPIPMFTNLCCFHANHWDMGSERFPVALQATGGCDCCFPKHAVFIAFSYFLAELGIIKCEIDDA